MNNHANGGIAGTRQGCFPVVHSFRMLFGTNPTATPIKLCTVKATAQNPARIRVRAVVGVASDAATTATLSVGTASSGTQFLNAVNIKAAAQTNYAPTNDTMVVTADTDIWGLRTITGAETVGTAWILVEVSDLNVNQPTAQGD